MAEDDNKPDNKPELRVIEGSAKPPTRLPPRYGPPRFPSDEHRDELSKKGFKGRSSDQDLLWWHAYDYGWRRVVLETRDDDSPIDPKREWFDAGLAAEAEEYWAKKYPASKKPTVENKRMLIAAAYRWALQRREVIPPDLRDSDEKVIALVGRFEEARAAEYAEQDRERAEAKARIIGNGRNPDGTPTEEALAFVALCTQQAIANLRGLSANSLWMKRMPDNSRMPTGDPVRDQFAADEFAELRKVLGVTATEERMAEELKSFRLPGADDPGVQEVLRQMEEDDDH